MNHLKKNLGDTGPETIVRVLSLFSVLVIAFIFIFIFSKAWPVLRASGIGLITQTGFDKQIAQAFYASAEDPVLQFGLLGLLVGTVLTTGLALVLAVLFGVCAAGAIAELAPRRLSQLLNAVVRLLASIHSVVFGLVGIITVGPLIQRTLITTEMQIEFLSFFQMTGRGLLASVIVLTFMIVPMVISLSIDAMEAVPDSFRETGYAFGMTRFRVIWKIVLPSARSGILAGVLLAAGRGIGESIAVSMVCGGVGYLPNFLFGPAALLTPVLPLSAAIVNKSEAMSASSVEAALFACGALLLVLGAILSIAARLIERRLGRDLGNAE